MPARHDLLTTPWITVSMRDGSTTDLSLLDTFTRAQDVRSLACETPSVDLSLLRLLLAIEYRALGVGSLERWEELHDAGWDHVARRVTTYLNKHAHRFILDDEDAPFLQLHWMPESPNGKDVTQEKRRSNLFNLIPDVRSQCTDLVTVVHLNSTNEIDSLAPAEAARWLVNLQFVDSAGTKGWTRDGDVLHPGCKGKRGAVQGSTTTLAGTIKNFLHIEGETLADTLLDNLVPLGPNTLGLDLHTGADDLPPWERPELTVKELHSAIPLRGVVDAYTRQTRAVRLFWNDDHSAVVNVAMTSAELTPNSENMLKQLSNIFSEPMTGFNKSKISGGKWVARSSLPSGRTMWKGLNAILPTLGGKDEKKDVLTVAKTPIAQWAAIIAEPGELVRLRHTSFSWGDKCSVLEECPTDVLELPAEVLQDIGLAVDIELAYTSGNMLISAAIDCLVNLEIASGKTPNSATFVANRERAAITAALDQTFNEWILHLPQMGETAAALWYEAARRVVVRLTDQAIDRADPRAYSGHTVKIGPAKHETVQVVDIGYVLTHRDTDIAKASPQSIRETRKKAATNE